MKAENAPTVMNDLGESKLKEMKLCMGRLRLKLKREKNATKSEKKKKEKKEKKEKQEKKESVKSADIVVESVNAEKKETSSGVAAAARLLGY